MAAVQLPINLPHQAVTRRELLAHLAHEGYRTGAQIVQELDNRNYATNDDVRAIFNTMFESTRSEFEDQRKSIMLLLDRTSVLNDEFGEKAREATERVNAALADRQKRQQEVVDHLQSQATDNSQCDAKIADFDQKIAAAGVSVQESSAAYESRGGAGQDRLCREQARAPGDLPQGF